MVPVTQRQNALASQKSITLRVASLVRCFIVLATIQLDRDSKLMTIEIKDVWPQRLLSPELLLVQASIPQQRPDDLLRFSGCGSKASDEV